MSGDDEPALIADREDVEEKIADLMEEGKSFLNRSIRSRDDLESVRSEYRTWKNYTEEFLKQSFTGTELAEEFGSPWSPAILQSRTLSDEANSFKKTVKERIQRLKTIKERLELFPKADPKSGSERDPVQYPDKVTVRWLINNVPVSVWLYLISILITVFVLGVTVGQTTFVKEIVNGAPKTEKTVQEGNKN